MKYILLGLLLLVPLQTVCAAEDAELFGDGCAAGRAGEYSAAYVYFSQIIVLHPDSKYMERALFSFGETNYAMKNYREAADAFSKSAKDHPDSKAKVFALAYLVRLSRQAEKEDLAKAWGKEIVASERLSLIFRDSKEYNFRSSLGKRYKAVYFIDKVEFYVDGQELATISY